MQKPLYFLARMKEKNGPNQYCCKWTPITLFVCPHCSTMKCHDQCSTKNNSKNEVRSWMAWWLHSTTCYGKPIGVHSLAWEKFRLTLVCNWHGAEHKKRYGPWNRFKFRPSVYPYGSTIKWHDPCSTIPSAKMMSGHGCIALRVMVDP